MNQTAFRTLLDLMQERWVRGCGAERMSRAGPPFHDAGPFDRILVESFPDRAKGQGLASPELKSHMPDDGALVDLLGEIVPSAEHMQWHVSVSKAELPSARY